MSPKRRKLLIMLALGVLVTVGWWYYRKRSSSSSSSLPGGVGGDQTGTGGLIPASGGSATGSGAASGSGAGGAKGNRGPVPQALVDQEKANGVDPAVTTAAWNSGWDQTSGMGPLLWNQRNGVTVPSSSASSSASSSTGYNPGAPDAAPGAPPPPTTPTPTPTATTTPTRHHLQAQQAIASTLIEPQPLSSGTPLPQPSDPRRRIVVNERVLTP
jgi:hypothetical protein